MSPATPSRPRRHRRGTARDRRPAADPARRRLRLRNGGRAFRHRNYRLFFAGQLVSLVGTWMQQVAQAWLVLELTGDPFVLGLVAALPFLPVLVLGLFGGLIADALPKRRTLIVTQTVQMILAFVLFGLTVTDTVEVWQILVLAAAAGRSPTPWTCPPARRSPWRWSAARTSPNAVALNSAVFNGGADRRPRDRRPHDRRSSGATSASRS